MENNPETKLPETCELLTVKQVSVIANIGVASVWRNVSKGIIPPPIKIGGSTRWRRSEIMQWIKMQGASQ